MPNFVHTESTELLLVRHAKSDWRFGALDDRARPLNRRGMRDCLDFVPRLATALPTPERVLVSPAARALQTGQALAQAFELPPVSLRVTEAVYDAGVPELRDVVAALPASCRVAAIVGHNPGLHGLYTWLTGSDIDNLPTLAVAHLRCPAGWQASPGTCEALQRLSPRGTFA